MKRLLIRPGAIGDLIVSLPAMEHLRADYLEVWASSQNLPLVRFADRVSSIAASGIDLLGLPDLSPPGGIIERLRSFDSIVSWYGSNREEFRKCVAELKLPFQFLQALPDGRMHAADFYLQQVGGSGPAVPKIECSRQPGNFAVIHPFSGAVKKNWPLAKFQELAKRIKPVRWCAGPEEELAGAARFDDLYDLASWLAAARIYVGNDSGITHLAAAVATPVIAVFGPADPAVWGPRGPLVRIVRASSMEAISVDEVLAAVTAVESV